MSKNKFLKQVTNLINYYKLDNYQASSVRSFLVGFLAGYLPVHLEKTALKEVENHIKKYLIWE